MTIIQPELSDLDLLDDEFSHCACEICYPPPTLLRFGVVYVAICGARTITRDDERTTVPPPDACPACLAVWRDPCSRCGR